MPASSERAVCTSCFQSQSSVGSDSRSAFNPHTQLTLQELFVFKLCPSRAGGERRSSHFQPDTTVASDEECMCYIREYVRLAGHVRDQLVALARDWLSAARKRRADAEARVLTVPP